MERIGENLLGFVDFMVNNLVILLLSLSTGNKVMSFSLGLFLSVKFSARPGSKTPGRKSTTPFQLLSSGAFRVVVS